MDDETAFRIIELIANSYYDGHYTIMRFTTNYRVCFGGGKQREIMDQSHVSWMPSGKTLGEALIKALEEE